MQCEVCGNHYDNAFTVTLADETYVFDCFECAVHALAPSCGHCGCKVIGHGVTRQGETFCCDHCAREALSADSDDDMDEADDYEEEDLDDDDEVESPVTRAHAHRRAR